MGRSMSPEARARMAAAKTGRAEGTDPSDTLARWWVIAPAYPFRSASLSEMRPARLELRPERHARVMRRDGIDFISAHAMSRLRSRSSCVKPLSTP
jgi:hypothetical protein